MDMVFLIGVAVVFLVVIGVIRSRTSSPPHATPRVVTQNLDYTILGQRPEIITEEDGDPQDMSGHDENRE